ncbi:hypothetical protein COCVIDRAFT_100288 [Bipolaris victoriae FI3]|uniref:Microbial-type PARG catalytic domain-containing protein n=1 Tax=Bipolaris victoriae (strain FI3) TaxID=930091 RepID=W7E893_BIPV3|nr:hypothetical protein COCVIDRAFT_100288 [Bipolaris victoriae FI3]
MGRTEKSQGLAPPAIRKDIRAKQARHIINKVVPALLASNARARRGVDGSELIADPGPNGASGRPGPTSTRTEGDENAVYVKRKGQGRRKAKGSEGKRDGTKALSKGKNRKRNDSLDEGLLNLSIHPIPPSSFPKSRTIRIITTDTLTAAHLLSHSPSKLPSKKAPNTCILNMASPLRPGGGVYLGATSQEEFLCARTTLLPSLKEQYYRLPEYGGIYTPDVLVFRNPGPLGDSHGELPPTERWYVDVISAGMLRFPELEGEEDEEKRLGRKDREVVERKIRGVLRIAESKGVSRLVLGAWGCGAYGNPVRDVAEAFQRVLDGGVAGGRKKSKDGAMETWSGIGEVVFAIANRKMAVDFADAFGAGIEVEDGPGTADGEDEDEEEDAVAEELRKKIQEMESQISLVWNADLKARMTIILDGLKSQLREREGTPETSMADEEDSDEEQDQDESEESEKE